MEGWKDGGMEGWRGIKHQMGDKAFQQTEFPPKKNPIHVFKSTTW